jgi:hypothetical protein
MSITFLTDEVKIGQNDRAVIGGNNPPEPTPFDLSKERIEGLYVEAKNWCDGEPIASQQQADEVQKLLRLIQEAEKEADERRKEEARPFDDGKAAVQAKYNPLIQKEKGKTALASAACKSALAVWLRKVDEENRKKAEEARKEAEKKLRAAQEAFRASQPSDLAEREKAEALAQEAEEAARAAAKAEKAKAHAKGVGRAATLRTYYVATVTDYREFARYLWKNYPETFEPFLDELASKMASAGSRSLPGVEITEDRRVA